MRAAWRPRVPLPRAAPRAAPALAPRARESFAARRPGRTDLGTAPCASPRRRRPFPAVLARPGAPTPGQPSSPAPGRGGPRGLLFGKTWWRLQRNPLPARWRAGGRHGVHWRCHRSEFGGRGRGSARRWPGAGGRFEIWWIDAACVYFGGCEGAQVLWGGGSWRRHQRPSLTASPRAPKFVHLRIA